MAGLGAAGGYLATCYPLWAARLAAAVAVLWVCSLPYWLFYLIPVAIVYRYPVYTVRWMRDFNITALDLLLAGVYLGAFVLLLRRRSALTNRSLGGQALLLAALPWLGFLPTAVAGGLGAGLPTVMAWALLYAKRWGMYSALPLAGWVYASAAGEGRKQARRLGFWFLIVAGVAAAVGLGDFVGLELSPGGRLSFIFFNPDVLGTYMLFAFNMSLSWLASSASHEIPAWGAAAIALVAGAAVLASGARAISLLVVLSLLLWGLVLARLGKRLHLAGILLATAVLVGLTLTAVGEPLLSRWLEGLAGQAGTGWLTARYEALVVGWQVARQHLIFGAGPSGFGLAARGVLKSEEALWYNVTTDNQYLDFLIELGIWGPLALVAVLLLFLRLASRQGQELSPLGRGVRINILVLSLAALAYSVFSFPSLAAALWFYAALLVMEQSSPEGV
ncbi:MAG: O-antigen ligase family protein [Bacillota bacterium]|nr:O-antigen ligase family protein [Bacillota bacterium]